MRNLSRSLMLLTMLAALPASVQAGSIVEENVRFLQAGDTVAVARIPEGLYLRSVNDPDDIIWERLPEYRVEVLPAPAVHASVELRVNYDAAPRNVYLNLAQTSERFYVRMRWEDATRNVETLRDVFRDGAAAQFALGDDATSYIMGDGPADAVNIWYWRSDVGEVQNLAAGGPGSTTLLDDQPVTGASHYFSDDAGKPSEWVVVMSRPIATTGDYEVSFRRPQIPMAFAIWQGADGERDGLKSVSDGWILLDMAQE